MICVQQLFGKLGKRLAQEVSIAGCHVGILVAKADLRIMVERSQHRRPLVGKLNAVVNGLAATANAAARARHDLNEVIVHSAALQRIEMCIRDSKECST